MTKSGESPGSDKPPTLNAGAVAVDFINVAVHLGLVVGLFLGVASPLLAQITQDAYVPNEGSNTVSVIDTATHAVTDTIPAGTNPYGAAVTPDGLHAYVTNLNGATVSEIDTATHAIVNTIAVGSFPVGIAVTPDGLHAYVANLNDGTVSVIDTATHAVVNTVAVGLNPIGVAVTPDGLHVFVANEGNNTVSEIDTATHIVVNTIPVGVNPFGVAVTPDGLHVFVANRGNNTVSEIDTATHAVINAINVGANPLGVAVAPDGLHAYVSNPVNNTVSVIDTATNIVNTIGVGSNPFGVAVTPDGLHVYVTNEFGATVSEIDTATHAVVNTITVGNNPLALGNFVGPNLITGTLSVTNEAELTTLGFGQFVDFRGGSLQTAAGLNDTHTLSLLTAGTIDTNGFDSTFSGNVIGVGAFIKTGAGTLTLSGTNTYTGGTSIIQGTLQIGTLNATGSIVGAVVNDSIFNILNANTAGITSITNNAGGTTTFLNANTASTAVITNVSGGLTRFSGTSTAATATIFNNVISFSELARGETDFLNASTAATAAITNNNGVTHFFNTSTANGATLTNNGGLVQFSDTSTAANSTITNNAGTGFGFGGLTEFSDGSTAGAAIITNNDGLTLFNDTTSAGTATVTNNATGETDFHNTSRAANATITNNNGGKTQFFETSTAGNASISNNAGGGTVFNIASSAGNSTILNNSGGSTGFNGTSTAGNATITTNSNGFTGFQNASTAGNATIITNGGFTVFSDTSTGGEARFITNTGGTVDISNLTSAGMTAGSIEGAGTYQLGSEAFTVGLNNLSTEVSGTIEDGGINGGTGGSLIKVGTGTLTLTGTNTYTGGTQFNGGILAVNSDANLGTGPLSFSGGTLEALATGGGITSGKAISLNTGGTFLADAGTASILNGVIDGTGSLTKDGPGRLTLTGKNTFSGGTVLSAGTLTVNGPQALGLGNVVLNGGILNADPQPINVKGNYTQNAGATLQLQVAGANPGQYDTLNVGGNAALGGTLQLISLGFKPVAGNLLTLVTTGGAVSSRFAQFVNPFATGPGFTTVDLVYGRNFVLLEFLNLAPPLLPVIVTTDFSSFAFTPNQLAAADLLDAVQLDPRAANFISFLNAEPFANLPSDFQKISPEGLTAFDEIGFSNANIQKLTLESRLDDLHHGSNGFSSNMKVNGATVNEQAGPDGKTSKAVMEPVLQHAPENRWGVWVTGFGDFVNVDGDGNAQGYNFTTGGVSLGLDYRLTDQLAIGVFGDYSHTWTSLNPSGHIDVDSGRGGVYATWFSHGIYLNAAIYGGHNSYDSGRAGLGGLANGSTEGAEWSTFIGGGYDFHFGSLTVGPIASLQYTDVGIDSFSEHGSLAPLAIHSDSAESLRSDVGFRLFYQWQIGKIIVEPSLKAAWEHEYKYSALPVTAGFAGIPGPSATFSGPSEGHDSAVVSAGVSVQLTSAISTYVNYDGQLGRDNYDSNAVTGGVRISF